MSKFLRLFSGKKKTNKELNSKTRVNETDIECKVVYLDTTDDTFFIEKKALGKVLEDRTFHHITVADDKNYFGLQFTDKKGINHWLDISKEVRKQCEIGPPYSLRFRVKFFSSDPCGQMNDEYTRYLFVLQLRQMIRFGELSYDNLDVAAELAAIALQGELGDFDEQEHTPLFISQYRFIPDSEQTEEFELDVLDRYKKFKNRNMLPSIADKQYLEKCQSLPDYGVDRHSIKGKDGKDYVLGLTPSGILIYQDNTKIGLFQWSFVTKLSFKKSRFKIVVTDGQKDEQGNMEHTFVFQSEQIASCKQLWKSCVEHHAFYRLEGAHKPPTRFQILFRLKSRFYASFHTEYQMAVKSTFGSSTKRNSTFQRTKSVRAAPRASFERNEIERKKIQQRNRDRVREENKAAALKQLNTESKVNPKNKTKPAPPVPSIPKKEAPVITTKTTALINARNDRKSSSDSSSSESNEDERSYPDGPKKSSPTAPPRPTVTKAIINNNNNAPRVPSRPAYAPGVVESNIQPLPRTRLGPKLPKDEIINV